jgi:hypothetical protein
MGRECACSSLLDALLFLIWFSLLQCIFWLLLILAMAFTAHELFRSAPFVLANSAPEKMSFQKTKFRP